MSVRILFVDDERKVLESLERGLFDMMDEWDMVFAESGTEALDLMQEEPADVIVSDMRMPGMDGASLLHEVKERHPDTIRFVLTGQVEEEGALRSVDLAHQFLSKPCDPELLQNLIARALYLRQLLNDEKLNSLVSSIGSLPSLPEVYKDLMRELSDPDTSLKVVAKIIGGDVAMCAKVLQLVNSAFFGLRNRVTDVTQATTYLGIDTIKSLVLANHAFVECSKRGVPAGFSLETLSEHGLAVGTCAQAIMAAETDDKRTIQDGFGAGLLHDLGKLVLAVNYLDQYGEVMALVKSEKMPYAIAEERILGVAHPTVGAYLLGLWGLPDAIVEAVLFHHAPHLCACDGLNLSVAVHAADYFVRSRTDESARSAPPMLDMGYLERTHMDRNLPAWQKACDQALEGSNDD